MQEKASLCTFQANGRFICDSEEHETFADLPQSISVQFTVKNKNTGTSFLSAPFAVPSLSSFKDEPKGFAMHATGFARSAWVGAIQTRTIDNATRTKVTAQVQLYLVNPAENQSKFVANLPSSYEETPLIISRLLDESRLGKYTHVELRLKTIAYGRQRLFAV